MAEEIAIFAGGCFWCMVQPFDQWEGVIKVTSGYTGGHTENPTYKEVCSGLTGHTEAVEIIFDSNIITYEQLLDIYWQISDPTDLEGQFVDRGSSYRPTIFYTSQDQKLKALASKQALIESGKYQKEIVTPIEPAGPFYPAEEYHQDFYKKEPIHYQRYKQASGRPSI